MKFTVDDLIEAIEAEHEYNGCPEQYTEQELRRLALAAVRGTVFWFCADCDEHTIDEYYMVSDDLWADYAPVTACCASAAWRSASAADSPRPTSPTAAPTKTPTPPDPPDYATGSASALPTPARIAGPAVCAAVACQSR
jgi:hypothetical protein